MDLRERIASLMGQVRPELTELVAIRSVADPRQFPPEECARAAQWVLGAFADAGFSDARLAEMAALRPLRRPAAAERGRLADPAIRANRDGWALVRPRCRRLQGQHRDAPDRPACPRRRGAGQPEAGRGGVRGNHRGPGGLRARTRRSAARRCDPGRRRRERGRGPPRPHGEPARRGRCHGPCAGAGVGAPLGKFGGAAPDALGALVAMLATLRDAHGNTTVRGLDNTQVWPGAPWPPESFRADAGVLEGVSLLGDGTVSDMVWSRPAVTICGTDCPPVLGSVAAIAPRASARLNLRVPLGMQAGDAAQALVSHLHAVAPWGVHVTAEIEAPGAGFQARTGGPAHRAIAVAMHEAYGRPMVTLGEGGAIPLCNVLADTYPDAELILMGVEEPLARIHAPNESVDPAEIAAMTLTEALFLQRYTRIRSRSSQHDPA